MLTVLSRLLVGSLLFVVIMQDLVALAIFTVLAVVCAIGALISRNKDEKKEIHANASKSVMIGASSITNAAPKENPAKVLGNGATADGDGLDVGGGGDGDADGAAGKKAQERGSDGVKGLDERFKAAIAEAEAMAKELRDETQAHWEPLAEKNGITVLSHSKLKNCTLSVLTVPADPESVLDVLEDVDSRCEWDPIMEETKCIRWLNNATQITYLRTKVQWPTSARDQVVLAHGHQGADGSILVYCKSVEHPDLPPEKGCVRADVKLAAYLMEPLGSDGAQTKLRAISYVDPKGYIPSRLLTYVNSVAVPVSLMNLQRRAKSAAARSASAPEARKVQQIVNSNTPHTEVQLQVDRVKRELENMRSLVKLHRRLSIFNLVIVLLVALTFLRSRR